MPPKIDPKVETISAAIAAKVKAYFIKAHDGTNTVQVKDVSNDKVDDDDDACYGEPTDDDEDGESVNDEFYSPFEQQIGPTGETRMYDDVLFAQYSNCHHELYYESCEIYGDDPNDSKEAIQRLANSGEISWTKTSTPLLRDDSMFYEDFLYDQYVIERNVRLAYQGILNDCEDVGITEADFHEAQAPLEPTIRRPDPIDYERMRKYFGHVPADIVRQTFKHTTQIGLLLSSTHLRCQFKSPNPALNLHRRNEADATDQIFAIEPAMNGGETSAHIFVGQDLKITDVYKSKDDSAESFLGAFQDRVRERGVHIKFIANNCPMYRGWNVTKYLQDLVVLMWRYETKH